MEHMIWVRYRSQPCQLVFDDLTGRLRALSNTGDVIVSHERTRDRAPLRFDGVSVHCDTATFDIDTARTPTAQVRAFVAVANGAGPAPAPPSATGMAAPSRTSWPSWTPPGLGVSPPNHERERAGQQARLAASVVVAAAWVFGIAGVVIGIVVSAQEDPACELSSRCGTLERYPLLLSGIVLAAVTALQSAALLMVAAYVQWRVADRPATPARSES